MKGSTSVLGALTASGTLALLEKLIECGELGYEVTYYSANAEPVPGLVVSCTYSCLADLSHCQTCQAQTGAAAESSTPDYDGISMWKYLDCMYRGGAGSKAGSLAYSYMFSNGVFQGTGSEVAEQMSCDSVGVVSALVQPFSLANLACDGVCAVTILLP